MMRRHRLAGKTLRQFDGVGAAGLQPAFGGHHPAAGVDAQHQPAGKLLAHPAKPVGLFDGQRADHHARGPIRAAGAMVASSRTPPPNSHGHVDGCHDRLEAVPVGDAAGPGAVEIDQVQVLSP